MVRDPRAAALIHDALSFKSTGDGDTLVSRSALFIKQELIPQLNDYYRVEGAHMKKGGEDMEPIGFLDMPYFYVATVPRLYEMWVEMV